MNPLLLFHLLSAGLMTLGIIILFVLAVIKKRIALAQTAIVVTFIATFFSGGALVFYGAEITHFCVTMSVYSLCFLFALEFYRLRTATLASQNLVELPKN